MLGAGSGWGLVLGEGQPLVGAGVAGVTFFLLFLFHSRIFPTFYSLLSDLRVDSLLGFFLTLKSEMCMLAELQRAKCSELLILRTSYFYLGILVLTSDLRNA